MPKHTWRYYQEWNNALFLHWKVPADVLKTLIPNTLELDTFEGEAWVSIVAFTMQKIRPRLLPSIKVISDFHEINLRTYVSHQGKAGVYFLNIEAEKALSALVSRNVSKLPYQKSDIVYSTVDEQKLYVSKSARGTFLEAEFRVKPGEYVKSNLDRWLTERYCLYVDEGLSVYCYDVHHAEWIIQDVQINRLKLNYRVQQLVLNHDLPDHASYSNGVKVLAWEKKKLSF